jgi:Eco29kI restriction endonuclease
LKKADKSGDTTALVSQLRTNLAALSEKASEKDLNSRLRKSLDSEMRKFIGEIEVLLGGLNPIRQPLAVFDPSDPKVVGRFVALALVSQERMPLAGIEPFYGSGVYALYYKGPFKLYAPISGTETPIYVGQAAPVQANARRPTEQGSKLSSRLNEHLKNILKAKESLEINDFDCRALVVQSGWETAAEDYLIHLFQPIWNSETKILYGLGKHGDKATTRTNKRSPWDTIHPARKWAAETVEDAKTPSQVADELNRHFEITRTYRTMDDLLHDFVQELRQS